MTFAQDTFAGTNNQNLQDYNPKWIARSTLGSSGYTRISDAQRIRSHYNTMYWQHAVAAPGSDVEVAADVYIAGMTNYAVAGVLARLGTGDLTCYEVHVRNGGGYGLLVELDKNVAGSTTRLGSLNITHDVGETVRIGLRCEGAKLTALHNGEPVIVVTDDAPLLAPGYPGLVQRGHLASSNAAGLHLDNWAARSLAAAPVRRRNRLALLIR